MPDKLNAEGSFGTPPAGAPHEVAQPLAPQLVADQIAKARVNERELPPFAPKQGPPPMLDQPVPVERVANPMPAASDGDSPSRGVPRPIGDPGKQITGGFGDAGAAQYFPIDGEELRQVSLHLLGDVVRRIENDLRFSMAITYPRVRVKVQLIVEGYAESAAFTIDKEGVPHDKTPVDVALAHGAVPVEFTVGAVRQEFSEDGVSEYPPDRMRDELGLQKPHKQSVGTSAGRMIVDRVTGPDDIF